MHLALPGVTCLGFRNGFPVTRRGKGNDAGAAPTLGPAPDPAQGPALGPGAGPRSITSTADRVPSPLDISRKSRLSSTTPAKAPPFPAFLPPLP